jgi:hypothetical protein
MVNSRKIRRIASLCLYIIGNIACYRAGWTDKKTFKINTDFWRKVNGNFLDIATLDWCKLFVDFKGKHHWSTIFSDKKVFREKLIASIKLSEEDFKSEVVEIKKYRDKFLAHLDEPTNLYYPKSEIILKSSMYLYYQLATNPKTRLALSGVNIEPQDFYDEYYQVALKEIENAETLLTPIKLSAPKKKVFKRAIAKKSPAGPFSP